MMTLQGGIRLTNLILRLFVKDFEKTDDPAVHTAIGKMAGLTGVGCNVLLFIGKLIAGLLTGAISIVADAVNNLSDAASSVVTLIGFHLAQRPADREHPYGHARYEYLSGLVVAALILVVGFELAKTSIGKILHPEEILSSPVTVAILAVSIAVKLWMSRFYKILGKRIHSVTLAASSADSRNDVISTAAVLAGYLVFQLFHVNIDGYVGLAVAVFILYSGIGVAKDTVDPLLGARADENLVDEISKLVLSQEKVLGIHDLLVHDYGPGQCFASVHAEMSAQEDPMECHYVIDGIEQDAIRQLNVHLVIHYDPVVTDDEELNEALRQVRAWIVEIDPRLTVHDFRMVRGARQTNLIFDMAVPFGLNLTVQKVSDILEGKFLNEGKNYHTIIQMDRCN